MKDEDCLALIDIDFPMIGPITNEIRENTLENVDRCRGSVRICNGFFWTDAEYETMRTKIYRTPLP
jgi:hypothetical protein